MYKARYKVTILLIFSMLVQILWSGRVYASEVENAG